MSADSTSSALDATVIQSWFTTNFKADETQLVAGISSELTDIAETDQVCEGLPSLQTRVTTTTPNGACSAVFTALNDSCTCLSGYDGATTWEFHVQPKSASNTTTTYPTAQKSIDVLKIDGIRTINVPTTVDTLRILGVSSDNYPVELTIIPQDRSVTTSVLPLAEAADGTTSHLTTVEIFNVNLSTIAVAASSFVPATTTNLTIRNCGISRFGSGFMDGLDSDLVFFDISVNALTAPYAGNSAAGTCANTLCGLQEFNISYNKLTTFPDSVFNLANLQKLYIQGNLITDFNVSASVFQSIQNLVDFKADLPDESAVCNDGEWQTAHGCRFCVATDGVSSAGTDAATSDSSSPNYLLYGVIGGGVVVVILLLVLMRQRWYSRASDESSKAASEFEKTSDFDDSYVTLNADLIQNPIIATHRIDYKDLKRGSCISRGGFGLVFLGEYHGRRVVIKKIRAENDGDVAQIQFFIKEITLMATLQHPRIVDFIGVAWNSLRNLSAVTEFMERGDLRDVLQTFKLRSCELTWENHKMTIALHIAEGLTYLHSLSPKVIHRDLKSKNVLLNNDLEAKLSDFGVSRERHHEETHMTAGIGTSFWIAPEVLLGHDYDERADIFSFGVVLSEIDTDDYPYWNSRNSPGGKIQEGEILQKVAAGILRPTFSDVCPKGILDLADNCLQANPADRPTAPEVVYALQKLLRDSSASWSS